MTYAVKEIFYTLQGEGANAGRPAVFCRFAGCNLWTGREADRAAATCTFCDTDFVGTTGPGGGKFATADALARAVVAQWPESHEPSDARERWRDESRSRTRRGPLVVCTGGEPLLQLDRAAIDALHEHDCEIAVETNGTQPAPHGIDWLCVSPKSTAPLVLERGDELKLVYPQHDAPPDRFESLDFSHFFLQPMDGASSAENTAAAVRYCLTHPRWRLSLQTHKMLGIP